MLPLASTLALVALAAPAEAAPPRAGEPLRADDPGVVLSVDTPGQVRTLCETLDPPERAPLAGDVVERSRALADREVKREGALAARYQVKIAPERLVFAEYDRDRGELSLSDRAWLTTARGALRVWMLEDRGLPVTAEPGLAERIVKAAARKALTLTLTFDLPDDDEVACAHPAGSRAWALGVEPFGWEYSADGRVLARGGEGRDRPMVSAAQGAVPRVEVSDPIGAEGAAELRGAVAARSKDLERCYARALAATPDLDGSVVAELDLGGGGGAPRAVRVAIDSVQDPGLTSCVAGVLAATAFPKGPATVAALPIHFELSAP
jgi:hypothetical protein